MNNNNSVGLIIAGVVAVLALMIAGKWLMDKRERTQPTIVRPVSPGVTPVAPPPVIVVPPEYPYNYPQYNRSQDFWVGYNDGWNGFNSRFVTPEYVHGYEVGAYDRRLGRHHYYDRYYPSGFQLRLPGFRLNIK